MVLLSLKLRQGALQPPCSTQAEAQQVEVLDCPDRLD